MENENTDGVGGQPTHPTSAQGTSTSAIDYDALAKALKPIITDEVSRSVQSSKDKRIAGLQGKVNDFEAQLAEYQQLLDEGFSKDAAKRFMKLQDSLREPGQETAEPANQQSVSNGTRDKGGSSVDGSVLEAIGLDPNSPEVTELLRNNASLEDYVNLVVKKKAKPAPQPGGVMSSPGATAPSSGDELDEISSELNRLYLNPRSNQSRINELMLRQEQILKSQR